MSNKIISPDISAIKYKKRKGKKRKKNPDTFWRPDAIRRIISDRIYTGEFYYGKTKKGKRIPKEKWQLSPYRQPQIIEKKIIDSCIILIKSINS